MKKIFQILLFWVLIGAFKSSIAQDNLKEINTKRAQTNLNGMKVLGGWALANITIGSIAYFNNSGRKKYFHQMNVMWNIVNIGIASSGYFGARNDLNKELSLAKSLKDQHKVEQLLLFNAGLDAAYIATGFFLKERGLRKSSDRLNGYGRSLILQGAFLLVFDAALYKIQSNNGKPLTKTLEKISLNFDGQQVGVVIKL